MNIDKKIFTIQRILNKPNVSRMEEHSLMLTEMTLPNVLVQRDGTDQFVIKVMH